jgi:hypothetical protein
MIPVLVKSGWLRNVCFSKLATTSFKFIDFRKAPPSVVSGYGKRSINLNEVVANFEKHTFLSQTDLTRTGIISSNYSAILATLLFAG